MDILHSIHFFILHKMTERNIKKEGYDSQRVEICGVISSPMLHNSQSIVKPYAYIM